MEGSQGRIIRQWNATQKLENSGENMLCPETTTFSSLSTAHYVVPIDSVIASRQAIPGIIDGQSN